MGFDQNLVEIYAQLAFMGFDQNLVVKGDLCFGRASLGQVHSLYNRLDILTDGCGRSCGALQINVNKLNVIAWC